MASTPKKRVIVQNMQNMPKILQNFIDYQFQVSPSNSMVLLQTMTLF